MKKITLTLIGLIAYSTSISAQEVKFGTKAGLNFAKISGMFYDAEFSDDNLRFNKGITTFHMGMFAEIKFTEKFALQPELLYSMQGGKYEVFQRGIDVIMGMPLEYSIEGKLNWNLHYINVPIMAKYYARPNIAFEVGPYIGFNVKSELKTEYDSSFTFQGETTRESANENEDFKKGTKSIDFGLGIGANYNLSNGLFAGIRYNISLSNIGNDFTEVDIDEDGQNYVTHVKSDNIKNGVIQVSVGYKF